MVPGIWLDHLSPYARVASAVLPFLGAVVMRIVCGKSRAIGWCFTASMVWLVINVLMAPFSATMRQDLLNLCTRWL
jgi:hypothetical protein